MARRLNDNECEEIRALMDDKGDQACSRLQSMFLDKSMTNFAAGVLNSGDDPCATGFATLDNFLQGGYYPGLHIIGALPSMGKTALTLQMATQMASMETPVLYFSFESESSEIHARIISRLMHLQGYNISISKLMSASGIREMEHIPKAMEAYRAAMTSVCDMGSNMAIVEGYDKRLKGNVLDYIRCYCMAYEQLCGCIPVVFIDYLQLIATLNNTTSMSDKQAIDNILQGLHDLSKYECKTQFILLSSFNRDAYSSIPTFAAFKESGNVEYYADTVAVLMPLELKNMSAANANAIAQVNRNIGNTCPARLTMDILKNRTGKRGNACNFEYYQYCGEFLDSAARETAHAHEHNPTRFDKI